MKFLKTYWLGIVIAFVYFLVLLFTLSDYGMNEDTPGHFMRGQTYLHKLLTGKDTYDQPNLPSPLLFIPGQRITQYKPSAYEGALTNIRPIANPEGGTSVQQIFANYVKKYGRHSFYEHNAWSTNYFLQDDGGHPPVSDILEAASNHIFYQWLNFLDDVEAYYLYVIVTAAMAVFAVYFFCQRVFGRLTAVFASVSLALYPLFFAEGHFNVKDPSETCYFALTVIGFYFWVMTKKKRWFAVFMVSTILAAGTKLNIGFVPFIFIPWLIAIRKNTAFKRWFHWKLIGYFAIFFVVNLTMLIFLWPYLWNAPFQKLIDVFDFYRQSGATNTEIEKLSPFNLGNGIDSRSYLYIVAMTPLPTLFFFITGFCYASWQTIKDFSWRFRKDVKTKNGAQDSSQNSHALLLVLLWFIIPVARVVRPGAAITGSIRQYLEFLPALAILSGIGIVFCITLISQIGHWNEKLKKIVFSTSLAVYSMCLLFTVVTHHPNQNVYFNSLTGGISEAMRTKLYAWDANYGNPLRQGVEWLNANAKPNADLALLDGTMFGISSLWLRPDIHFSSSFSSFDQKGEYIISLVYPQPPNVFAYLYLDRFLTPVHEITVDGVAIAKVWQNDAKYVKPGYQKMVSLDSFGSKETGRDKISSYWQLNFPKPIKLTSITFTLPTEGCGKRDGLFLLNDYFVPRRIDNSTAITTFSFPAESTNRIRFYTLIPQSCFQPENIAEIKVLE